MAMICKMAVKGRVVRYCPVSEPGLVRAGTEKADEHGPGAGASTGRGSRVRPLLRFMRCVQIHGDCHASVRTGSQ